MKRFILLAFACLVCTQFATAQQFEWARSMGGSLQEIGQSVATSASGAVYTLGTFEGPADFDPGPSTYNLSNNNGLFISKLNATGGFVWAKQLDRASSTGYDITLDALENIYITGSFSGTADFDPGPGVYNLAVAGGGSSYVAKYDSAGNFVWAKALLGASSGDVRSTEIALDPSGNVFVAGGYFGTVDFNPGLAIYNLTTNSLGDAFLCKLDGSGNFLWAHGVGSADAEVAVGLDVDNAGNAYVLSTYWFFLMDVYFYKFNAAGTLQWAKIVGGSGMDVPNSLAVDGAGNLYVTGHFMGTADFDPNGTYNLTSAGGYDIFVLKLNTSGDFQWAKRIGGASTDYGIAIAVDAASNCFLRGIFTGTVDFDPGAGVYNLTQSLTYGIYTLKLDANGGFGFVVHHSGNANAIQSNSIAISSLGPILMTGSFGATIDFDPGLGVANLTSQGQEDVYVLKLGVCNLPSAPANMTTSGNLNICAGSTTTLSATGTGNLGWYAASSGGAYLGAGGSFVTPTLSANTLYYAQDSTCGASTRTAIAVMVRQPTSRTINVSACSNYTLNAQTYTSSGTYVQHLTNSVGCDSAITLNLIVRQPSTHTINASACSSYILNAQTYTSSGTYVQHLTNSVGCDSAITLNLIVRQPSTHFINASACSSYTLNAQTYSSSGTYVQHLTNSVGCDSAITLNLIVRQPSTHLINASACMSYTLNAQTYTSSGTYVQHLTNSVGCDSAITLNLIVRQPSAYSITTTACSSYTLNAQTYTSSGTYVQHLTNSVGCDSAITLHLVIRLPSTRTINASACSNYTLNAQTYSSSGTYVQHLINSVGCDSAITLNLVVRQPSAYTITTTACVSYTLNAQTYTNSGTYVQHLTNSVGCDSAITLQLTIGGSASSTLSVVGCGSYLSPSGHSIWVVDGTYMDTIPSAAGCDSIMTIHFTIQNLNLGVQNNAPTLHALASGASYQWIYCDSAAIAGQTGQNFTATANGSYAVIVSQNGCSDTSVCVAVTNIVGVVQDVRAGLLAYPNPTAGRVVVESVNREVTEIVLRNSLGHLLLRQPLGAVDRTVLEIEGAAGVYFMEVKFGDGEWEYLKVVKEK